MTRKFLLVAIAVLLLAGARFAQDDERPPGNAGEERLLRHVRSRLESVLPLLGESVERRYGLEKAKVDALEASVLEASLEWISNAPIGHARETIGIEDARLIAALVAEREVQTALAKHLDEKQVRDYLDFTAARRQRDKQAAARQLAAALDRPLCLTVEQREKVVQLLESSARGERSPEASARGDATDRRLSLNSYEVLRFDPSHSIHHASAMLRGQLKGVLAAKQLELLRLLTGRDASGRSLDRDEGDDKARRVRFQAAQAEIIAQVRIGAIAREEAAARIEALKARFWPDDGEEREELDEDGDERERERQKSLAEAVLAVHTEQLGLLDDRASRRLELVTKGVVERYLESRESNRPSDREAEWNRVAGQQRQMVAAGRITEEQMEARLEGLRQRWAAADATRAKQPSVTELPNQPLYRKTIEKVLSEEPLARYRAYESERLAYRRQAQQQLVVASMDSYLFLSRDQRAQLEAQLEKLQAPIASDLLGELFRDFDRSVLSELQRRRFRELPRFFDWTELFRPDR